MTAFTESEERQELRRQVAKLAATFGREYFTEKALLLSSSIHGDTSAGLSCWACSFVVTHSV